MLRPLSFILIVLLLLARPAWSEEVEQPPDGIDPAHVAKLLLSDDEDERARGAALLGKRMQLGGDVQTWLVAMARAQASWANADERLVERWIDDVLRGTPERAERARRLLAAVGRAATQRLLQALRDVQSLLPQAPGPTPQQGQVALPSAAVGRDAPPQANAPAPPREPRPSDESPTPQAPVAAARPPVGRIHAEVIEIPNTEIFASLAANRSAYGADARDLAPLEHEQAVVVSRRGAFTSALALPEARVRPVVPSQDFLVPGRSLVLVQGDAVRYRSRARKTKGAWAIDTDTLRRGLHVSVRIEGEALEIEARYVTMPDPLPTEPFTASHLNQPGRSDGSGRPVSLARTAWAMNSNADLPC